MPNLRKTLGLLTLLVAVTAGAAFGQAGYIGLYADATGVDCTVPDNGSGQVTVYVIHHAASGTTGSQWKIAASNGFDMTYVDETMSFVAMGTTQSGVSASYGSCLSSQILLGTVTYVSHGLSTPCSYLQVVPDPNASSGAIEVMDCSSQKNAGVGSRLYVNPNGSCPCGQVNPVEETDWGRIKAMFSG
jgi:hypothetical protein